MNTLQQNQDPPKGEVLIMQRLLKQCGYPILIDGDFGDQTFKIVRQFQADQKGLTADGVVGPDTWEALLSHKNVDDAQWVNGLDISHHQKQLQSNDWIKILNDPSLFSFCFVEAVRENFTGDLLMPTFWLEMKTRGMIRGVYQYLNYKDGISAEKQASFFLKYTHSSGIDFTENGVLRPVLDVEPQSGDLSGDWMNANKERVISYIRTWVDIIEKATGVVPIIYTNQNNWNNLLDNPQGFHHNPLWVANYDSTDGEPKMPDAWNNYTFWQYKEGSIEGITNVTNFDLNRYNGNMRNLLRFAGYESEQPQVATIVERSATIIISQFIEVE